MKQLAGPMKQLPGPITPTKKKPPPGQRGKKRDAHAIGGNDPHDWIGSSGRRDQPAWLNGGGSGTQTCRKCGIERKPNPMERDINADHAGFGDDGERLMASKRAATLYTYTDAKGREFQTTMELGCPMLLVDEAGAIRENRQMVRNVDDRVDYVDDRVDDSEHRIESVEDRLTGLEQENIELRAKIEERIDVTAMVEWLSDMVAVAAAQKLATVNVQIEGGAVAALPEPVANLIIDIARVPERELVPVREMKGSEPTHRTYKE